MSITSFLASPELQDAFTRLSLKLLVLEGETLFRQGALPKGIYLVLDGQIGLITLNDSDEEISRLHAGPGALLGVSAALCSSSYSFSAKALSRSAVAFVETDRFYSFLRSRPDLCLAVVQNPDSAGVTDKSRAEAVERT